MMKCRRALPTARAAEHGSISDIFLAAPGELLSIPVHACREKDNPRCQCRRVFVGLGTGQPTTLARISTCSIDEIDRECENSSDVFQTYDENPSEDGILLHELRALAHAIRQFEIGSIVRVDRTENAVILQDTRQLAIHHEQTIV